VEFRFDESTSPCDIEVNYKKGRAYGVWLLIMQLKVMLR